MVEGVLVVAHLMSHLKANRRCGTLQVSTIKSAHHRQLSSISVHTTMIEPLHRCDRELGWFGLLE